jgi:virginiamycin B lyase
VLVAGLLGTTPILAMAPMRLAAAGCAAIMPGAALPCLMAFRSQVARFHSIQAARGVVTVQDRPVAAMYSRHPYGITLGPDGNLWFAETSSRAIGRITPQGTVHEFPLPPSASGTKDVAASTDGSLWFTLWHGVGRIAMDGNVQTFSLPDGYQSNHIVEGADGAMWFTKSRARLLGRNTASGYIGRITASGTISEIPIEHKGSYPDAIVTGPDKAIWFTLTTAIGRLASNGRIEYFESPYAGMIQEMCVGLDGSLWFTVAEHTYRDWIGRITMNGTFSHFNLTTVEAFPQGITTGPDGNLWYVDYSANLVGRMTPSGNVTTFGLPHPKSYPMDIVSGPDGNLWFTEEGRDIIGRITPEGKITEFLIPGVISGTAISQSSADRTRRRP